MIVVDVQVVAYATLPGPYGALAERVTARDNDWAAPLLWRSEYLNVLAGQIRREAVSVNDAVGFLRDAATLISREIEVDAEAVLMLISASNCTAYDLEYVAAAQSLGVPLVTNDRQILTDFPRTAVSLESFAAGSA